MNIRKLGFLFVFASFLSFVNVDAKDYFYLPQVYEDSCCESWCHNWGIYGDYLYWRARRCDLDFAIDGDPSGSIAEFGSPVHAVEPSYDSGFRVGLQINGICGGWLFDAFYTYFSDCESEKAFNNGDGLTGTRLVPNLSVLNNGTLASAQSKWDICYDVVDILLGRELCSRNCFQTYLFGGLKLAFIDQEFVTNYALGTGRDRIKQTIDMDAYGVDLGVGAKYEFCGCFNIFGRTSLDLLIGEFKRKYIYQTSTNAGGSFTNEADLHDDCWRMVSVCNLSFGLGYDYLFSECWCTDLGIAIGYEFHMWSGQSDFIDLQSFSDQTMFDHHLQSLGFDGLFIRASLGF